jgi:hypothetical protein
MATKSSRAFGVAAFVLLLAWPWTLGAQRLRGGIRITGTAQPVAPPAPPPSGWTIQTSPVDLPTSYVTLEDTLPDALSGAMEIDVGVTPTGGKKIITVDSGQNLQTALNDARQNGTLCDAIRLESGATFTGQFTFPAKSASSCFIHIYSSNIGDLPVWMNRVNPDDLTGDCGTSAGLPCVAGSTSTPISSNTDDADFATIAASGTAPHYAIEMATGAHHFKVVGVEIACTAYCEALIRTYPEPDPGGDPGVADIIFDRVYVHTNNAVGGTRGFIVYGCDRCAIVNSFIINFWENDSDAQAILVTSYSSVFTALNNYATATGEVIYWDNNLDNIALNPTDGYARWNHFRMNFDWRGHVGWTNTKNLIETKSSERVLIEANFLSDCWGENAQETCINWKIGDEVDAKYTANFTFRYNKGIRMGNFIKVCQAGCNGPGLEGERFAIIGNIAEVSGTTYGRDNSQDGMGFYQVIPAGATTIVANNTILNDGRIFGLVTTVAGTPSAGIFINNIGNVGDNPLTTAEFNAAFPGGSNSYTKNVIVGGTCSNYPAGNECPAAYSNVQFENYNGGVNGDYRLASGSPYKGTCPDTYNVGTTDCGANVTFVNNAVSCAVTGQCASWAPLPPAPLPMPLLDVVPRPHPRLF